MARWGSLRPSRTVTVSDVDSNSVDLDTVAEGVRCTSAGDFPIVHEHDSSPRTITLAVGEEYIGRIKRINTTGLTGDGFLYY